jgi:hypothetical protein
MSLELEASAQQLFETNNGIVSFISMTPETFMGLQHRQMILATKCRVLEEKKEEFIIKQAEVRVIESRLRSTEDMPKSDKSLDMVKPKRKGKARSKKNTPGKCWWTMCLSCIVIVIVTVMVMRGK